MKKRITNYISYATEYIKEDHSYDELSSFKEDLLIQISFFQHERFIHLIVTMFFALFTIICMVTSLFTVSIYLIVLTLLFLILLIPYVRHYYILENGVQRLYKVYDEIKKSDALHLTSSTGERGI